MKAELSQYYLNGRWESANTFQHKIFDKGTSIYEVIRIIDGIPLFLEDHLNRLVNSAKLIDFNLLKTKIKLEEIIKHLIRNNLATNENIQLVVNYSKNKAQNQLACFFIKSSYPNSAMYENGILCQLHHAERSNPNVKQIDAKLRRDTNANIKSNEVYEVILVDNRGYITEGSRSNIFLVKDECVFTPPFSRVLPGITLQYIFKCCKENNIPIIEKSIQAREINNYEAAFLTGTSPKVLPINRIGEAQFDPQSPLLQKIRSLYNQAISDYLKFRS